MKLFDRSFVLQSRIAGFIVIGLVYLLALALGIQVFQWTDPARDILWRLFWADFAATVFVWAMGAVFDNASVYDPYWSVAPPVILTILAVRWQAYDFPSLMLLAAVWFWAVRLTVNWAVTFRNLGVQDWRYDKYKSDFPRLWQLVNFFGINLMPTVIVFLCVIPGIYLLQLSAPANLFTFLGFLLSVAAALLQLVSDRQSHRFRREHPGEVCDTGLWSYSRHPNYLGEILMWWGVWIMLVSVSGDRYLWTGIGSLVNTLLFVFISIPLMEKRQLARKPGYAAYRKHTGMLLPKLRRNT